MKNAAYIAWLAITLIVAAVLFTSAGAGPGGVFLAWSFASLAVGLWICERGPTIEEE